MFFRLKKSGERAYVQIVENKRVDGAVRQSVSPARMGWTCIIFTASWPGWARRRRRRAKTPSRRVA